MSRKRTIANGKMKFAGKLANTCTTGCRYWATRGLKPIQTPTGTQTTDATATTTPPAGTSGTRAERVPEDGQALLPGGEVGKHAVQAIAEHSGDDRGEGDIGGAPPGGVAHQAAVINAGGGGHQLVDRLCDGAPPRPASPGQLDRRNASRTIDRGLALASVCSRRNRSTYATSGRQNTTLTARIMTIMVMMPQTTCPS